MDWNDPEAVYRVLNNALLVAILITLWISPWKKSDDP